MAVLNRFGRKTIAELITDICYYQVLIESEKMNALSPYDNNSEPLALQSKARVMTILNLIVMPESHLRLSED